MNTKAEEKARTRSASKRAGSVGITKPNTVSPKARKQTPNKVKADPTPTKPPARASSVPVKPPPSQDVPVTPVLPSKYHPPSSPENFICKTCSASISSPDGVKDAAAQIKEDLLETRLTISRLNLAARHLILDPNKSLENLGEQAGRVASLCSKVEEQFNAFRSLLSAQYSCLSSKVDNLTLSAPEQPNDALKTLSCQIEEVTRLNKHTCEQTKENQTNTLKVLSQRLDVLSKENKELSRAAQLKLQAVADQLLKHDAKIDELLSKPSVQQQLPQIPVNVHQMPDSLPPPPTQPYLKLTPGFLKAILMVELKVWLAKQSFTQIGNREVLYVGDYDYWYGKVRHSALKPPKVIQDILALLRDGTGSTANSCLITRYLNGRSTCPEHEDDEPVINPASDIGTLSVGPTRKMILRRKTRDGNIIAEEVELPENSLLTFSRKSQDYFTHEIPADDAIDEVRYSLTFRDIKPFYLNSTLLIGDSNCKGMEFGSEKKLCFGKWMPGQSIFTPRISKIPAPSEILPYRNIIINVGINDLTVSAPLPPYVLVNELELKCHAIHQTYPKTRIMLMAVLPTRSLQVNSWVNEFNYHLKLLSKKNKNLLFIDTHDTFCEPSNPSGLLAEQLASRNNADIKHLNRSGVYKLRDLFKESVFNLKSLLTPLKNEIPWCYPSHRPSSPKEQFNRGAVPGMRSRSFSLSSCGSDLAERKHGEVIVGFEALDSVSGAVVVYGSESLGPGKPNAGLGLLGTPVQLITSDSPPHSQPPPS